ncbi:MAG: SufS family cysteine desulfurase [Nostoc sp.]|uniref:SufS family cysteine desulfurase n=1 Tax=Nostoc sp. TaxID=1180 RepID=UPI002FF523E8
MTINKEITLAQQVRRDFPILQEKVNGKPLVYLDNAETSQKPLVVVNALRNYYLEYNSNVHRGVHTLSDRATEAYEGVRDKIAKLINATSQQEIVYTRNATEAINLVAHSWAMNNLRDGDEIILSVMEHDSNIIPWQLTAQQTGAVLKFVELTPEEEFDLEHFKSLISERTKLVSVVHLSNTLGCINPVQEIIAIAHEAGAKILIDACQSLPHIPIDVQKLDCDWLAASAHKMCGPTGIGFLYGKLDLLRKMPPFLGGGKMNISVRRNDATYADVPDKFEAGTPAVADTIAFGAAIDYLTELGMDNIYAEELQISQYLFEQLQQIPKIRTYGPKPEVARNGRLGISIFTIEDVDPHNLCAILDRSGIVINSGFHATEVLHQYLGITFTARVSLYFYNTRSEIDTFITALKQAVPKP